MIFIHVLRHDFSWHNFSSTTSNEEDWKGSSHMCFGMMSNGQTNPCHPSNIRSVNNKPWGGGDQGVECHGGNLRWCDPTGCQLVMRIHVGKVHRWHQAIWHTCTLVWQTLVKWVTSLCHPCAGGCFNIKHPTYYVKTQLAVCVVIPLHDHSPRTPQLDYIVTLPLYSTPAKIWWLQWGHWVAWAVTDGLDWTSELGLVCLSVDKIMYLRPGKANSHSAKKCTRGSGKPITSGHIIGGGE